MRSNFFNKSETLQGVNLDVNACWGVIPEIHERLSEIMGNHGLNPSSIHSQGQRAKYLIEEARDSIRRAVNASSSAQIIFTSGATEANNLALLQPLLSGKKQGEYVTTAMEHPSVLEPLAFLSMHGFSGKRVKPSAEGEISPEAFLPELTPETSIVSIMLANNEIGSILPVSKIAESTRGCCSALIHTDAVQAFGKVVLDFAKLGVDLMSLSAHKIGALPGVGALVIKEGIRITPLIHGGPQEKHLRAGTENVLGILAFGIAAELVQRDLEERIIKMREAREIILSELRKAGSSYHLWNNAAEQLPNTLSIRFHEINADDLVVALDLAGVLISSGAACASGKPDPSHVLLSLGASEQEARETIRVSVGTGYTGQELKAAAATIAATVNRMRSRG